MNEEVKNNNILDKTNISADELLERIQASELKLKIISFFREYQCTMETAENLAVWIRDKDVKRVEDELKDLTDLSVLDKMGNGRLACYSLTSDLQIYNTVDKFFKELKKKKEEAST